MPLYIFQCVLLGVSSFAQSAHSSLAFQPMVQLPVGDQPVFVVAADINRDGKKDIIAANTGSDNISVYLGNGKGDFTPAKGSPFPAGKSPNDIAVGDVNDDGNPDLALANHDVKFVTVLLGDGTGGFSFASGSPFPVQSRPHPHGIATADFNGDKKLDIVIESWAENKVIVFRGNGDGTFQSPGTRFDVGKMPYQRLRSADLNEDGHADIITTNFEGHSISILFGDDGHHSGARRNKEIPVPENPFGSAAGDFNGDRHTDLAIVHFSGQGTDPSKNGLSVLFGDGKGNFTTAKGSPFPTGHYPPMVAAGDVNGDGIMDMVVPNVVDNTVTIYLGGKNGIKEASGSPFSVGRHPACVALGDLNNDGLADLVIAQLDDNNVAVLLSTKK